MNYRKIESLNARPRWTMLDQQGRMLFPATFQHTHRNDRRATTGEIHQWENEGGSVHLVAGRSQFEQEVQPDVSVAAGHERSHGQTS